MQALNPRRLIQGHTKHTSVHLLVLVGYISSWQLTMLSPKIMLHQKRTLFNRVRPLTHLQRSAERLEPGVGAALADRCAADNGNVPFAGEFEPVTTIPPVCMIC